MDEDNIVVTKDMIEIVATKTTSGKMSPNILMLISMISLIFNT